MGYSTVAMKTVYCVLIAVALAHAAFDTNEVEPFNRFLEEEFEQQDFEPEQEPEEEFTESFNRDMKKGSHQFSDDELAFLESPDTVSCDPNKAKREANEKLAKALTSTIKFDPNKTTLKKDSEVTLNGVVKTLDQFPWLEVDILGHSTARGSYCQQLTQGRAKTVIDYLKNKGAKNKMNAKGQCGKMIGVEIKGTGGTAPIPHAKIEECKKEKTTKEAKQKSEEKAEKAAAEKSAKKKAEQEKASKILAEKSEKEKVDKKEKSDKEKGAKAEKAEKEKVGKETASKEKAAKEKEKRDKESAVKEKTAKEKAEKEKEKASKILAEKSEKEKVD